MSRPRHQYVRGPWTCFCFGGRRWSRQGSFFFCMNLLFDKFVATSAMLVCNPAFVHVPRFGLAFYWTLWLGRRSMKSFVHVFFPMSDLGQVSQFRGNPRIQKARTNNNEWTRLACCTGHQYIINRIMIIITTNAMNTIAACKMIKKTFS